MARVEWFAASMAELRILSVEKQSPVTIEAPKWRALENRRAQKPQAQPSAGRGQEGQLAQAQKHSRAVQVVWKSRAGLSAAVQAASQSAPSVTKSMRGLEPNAGLARTVSMLPEAGLVQLVPVL